MNRIILLFFCNCIFNLSSAMEQDSTHPTKRGAPESVERTPKRTRQQEPTTQLVKPASIRLIANDGSRHLVFESAIKQSPVLSDLLANKRRDVQEQLKTGKIDETKATIAMNELSLDVDRNTLYLLTTLMLQQYQDPSRFDSVIENLKTVEQIHGMQLSGTDLLQGFASEALIKASDYDLPTIAQYLAELILTPHNLEVVVKSDRALINKLLQHAPVNRTTYPLYMQLANQTTLDQFPINKLLQFIVGNYPEIAQDLSDIVAKLSPELKQAWLKTLNSYLVQPLSPKQFGAGALYNAISNHHLMSIWREKIEINNLLSDKTMTLQFILPVVHSRITGKLNPNHKIFALKTSKGIYIFDLTQHAEVLTITNPIATHVAQHADNLDWISNNAFIAEYRGLDRMDHIYQYTLTDKKFIEIIKTPDTSLKKNYAFSPTKKLIAFVNTKEKIDFFNLKTRTVEKDALPFNSPELSRPGAFYFDKTGDYLLVIDHKYEKAFFVNMDNKQVNRCNWSKNAMVLGSPLPAAFLLLLVDKKPTFSLIDAKCNKYDLPIKISTDMIVMHDNTYLVWPGNNFAQYIPVTAITNRMFAQTFADLLNKS